MVARPVRLTPSKGRTKVQVERREASLRVASTSTEGEISSEVAGDGVGGQMC